MSNAINSLSGQSACSDVKPSVLPASHSAPSSAFPEGVVLQSRSNITMSINVSPVSSKKRKFTWTLSRKENKRLWAERKVSAAADNEN